MKRRQASQRFGGSEQFVEVEHPQQAGAAERGAIDGVGTGERAGVGRGGACAG